VQIKWEPHPIQGSIGFCPAVAGPERQRSRKQKGRKHINKLVDRLVSGGTTITNTVVMNLRSPPIAFAVLGQKPAQPDRASIISAPEQAQNDLFVQLSGTAVGRWPDVPVNSQTRRAKSRNSFAKGTHGTAVAGGHSEIDNPGDVATYHSTRR
jgi:hypothetical protein